MTRTERWLAAAIALALGVRVALAATLELGRDEAAYWYWAWHGLDASYSLLTGALVRLSTAAFGDGAFAVRLPGLLAGVAAVAVVFRASRRLGASREAAAGAALALAASPWQLYAGTTLHPDAFLTLALLVAADQFARGRIVVASLACVAVAFTKFTGLVIFAAAVVWILVSRPGRATTLASLSILVAGAAVLLASRDTEVLAGMREFGRFDASVGVLGRVAWTLAGVALLGGPALVTAVRGLAASTAGPARWLAASLLVFFAIFLLAGQAKANWFLPAFAVLLPVAAARYGVRGIRASVALSLAGALLWLIPVRVPPRINDLYARQVGSREAAVSPTRSWTERRAEYHDTAVVDATCAVVAAMRGGGTGGASVAPDAPIVSNDYGLAFQVAHRLGRRQVVRLPWDPVFARTVARELRPGDDVLFVSTTWEEAPREWADAFAGATVHRESRHGARVLRIVEYEDFRGGSAR